MLRAMSRSTLACVVLAAGIAIASEPDRPQPPADLFTRRIVFAVPQMEKVPVQRDRVYAQPGGRPLKMPAGARRPAIVFIHGGPLPPGDDPAMPKPKDWGVYRSYGQLAAASG